MELHVGDTARIIGNTSGHHFELGELVKVDNNVFCDPHELYCKSIGGQWYTQGWYVRVCDLAPACEDDGCIITETVASELLDFIRREAEEC